MLESTRFEGYDYNRGEEYEMDEEKAHALGTSVEFLEKRKIQKSPKDKMMTGDEKDIEKKEEKEDK